MHSIRLRYLLSRSPERDRQLCDLCNIVIVFPRENYLFVCSCPKCVSQMDELDLTSSEEEGDDMEEEITDVWGGTKTSSLPPTHPLPVPLSATLANCISAQWRPISKTTYQTPSISTSVVYQNIIFQGKSHSMAWSFGSPGWKAFGHVTLQYQPSSLTSSVASAYWKRLH